MRRRIISSLVGLLLATLGHFILTLAAPPIAPAVDLFLVVTLLSAIRGGEIEGMLVGLVAGIFADAITGGPFGLHGFTLTLTGYLVGLAADRVAEMTELAAGVLAAAGALVSRLVLVGLYYLFVTTEPMIEWWAEASVVGTSLILIWILRLIGNLSSRLGSWKRTRHQGRLRI